MTTIIIADAAAGILPRCTRTRLELDENRCWVWHAAVDRLAACVQIMASEMDVLEIQEDRDALRHSASSHEKAPPVPEDGGEQYTQNIWPN